MMGKVSAASLPQLNVTGEDVAALRDFTSDIERESMRVFEQHAYGLGRRIDATKWKLLKSRGDVRVYSERNTTRSEWAVARSFMEHSKVPVLLAEGTVAGTLDDAMYAEAMHDTPSLWLRNVINKEAMEDCAVLSQMDGPTLEDPFQFMGVVWMVRSFPGFGLVRRRDMLLLRRQHMSMTSRGERVGVVLLQSITHRDLPELAAQQIIRMRLSHIVIFRQIDEQRVQVFSMQYVNPLGSVLESLITSETANAMLCAANLSNTCHKKKLHHLVRNRVLQQTPADVFSQQQQQQMPQQQQPFCACCNRLLHKRFQAGGTPCQLCHKVVCAKCRVTHKVFLAATSTRIVQRPFVFCVSCWLQSKTTSAWSIARTEVEERASQRDKPPTSESLTRSDSSLSSPLERISMLEGEYFDDEDDEDTIMI